MGLDMYLYAEKYISGYEHRGTEMRKEYDTLVEMFDAKEFVDPETPSGNVNFVVAYWRKANHIHNWFVSNVQEGVDDCKSYWVAREQLQELLGTCQRVLAETPRRKSVMTRELHGPKGLVPTQVEEVTVLDTAIAEELLPTQSGFFFGNTEYDEWYIHDVEETVKQLSRALSMPEQWDFYYRASW